VLKEWDPHVAFKNRTAVVRVTSTVTRLSLYVMKCIDIKNCSVTSNTVWSEPVLLIKQHHRNMREIRRRKRKQKEYRKKQRRKPMKQRRQRNKQGRTEDREEGK